MIAAMWPWIGSDRGAEAPGLTLALVDAPKCVSACGSLGG